jgi:hypothetical protein
VVTVVTFLAYVAVILGRIAVAVAWPVVGAVAALVQPC